MVRTSAAGVLAVIVAAIFACAGADAATPPLMTYITDLNKPAPQVWVSGIGGSSATDLGPASSALISPDGDQVAALAIQKESSGKAWTLTLYATEGGASVAVIQSVQFMQLLAWSPDSKLILVAIGASPAQLRVLDTTTGESHTIATGVIDGASFAPDGSDRVVYARAQVNTTHVNLYTTSSTGADTRQLTHDGLSELPLWGPAGIVYSHETAHSSTTPYPAPQLWLITPSGRSERRLTAAPGGANAKGTLTAIAFSGNGKHLLANLVGPQGSNHAEAYAVDLSGSTPVTPRDISGQGNGTIGDAISSNGASVLLNQGLAANQTPQLETIPWAGGKPTVIVARGAYGSWDL
jgi:dipeptidyl aminopeptidase/acylaminoacyl peptidase